MVNLQKIDNDQRLHSLLVLAIGVVSIILLNIIGKAFYFRWDLTEEKRYSISQPSKEILEKLDDQVYVEVYLDGELPSGFKRLRNSIQETLEEFQQFGGKNVVFKFSDPLAGADANTRNRVLYQLAQKGLHPTNIFTREGNKKVEKLILPGAVINYHEKQLAVSFLKGNSSASPEEVLNQSVENVEFELINGIKKLSVYSKKRIGFTEGHGEFSDYELSDLIKTLGDYYVVDRLDLNVIQDLTAYQAIVIPGPKKALSDDEVYKLDQYVMNGGRLMFFIDQLDVRVDSVGKENTFAYPLKLNLENLLFRYGVRVNDEMVMDLTSGMIPLNVGNMGDKSQVKLMPWPYFPLLSSFGNHPITKNMDAIYSKFVTTIDTVKADGIKKTPLLFSSPYTRLKSAPVLIDFSEARKEPDPASYNKGQLPVAYLLEGSFQSMFKNRLLDKPAGFKDSSPQTRILVCADADMISNEYDLKQNQMLSLGFDKYTQKTFANKDFFVNSLDYLLDEKGILLAKNKEITLRPLDKLKVKKDKFRWQLMNILLP
ncbi:MAG: gliding motility-associated ABC transporter substrate-binding protein GldG, partial [Cytophagales bacterium]|nr:gliding motility-associated ABC transporter substrate-binding protein GldG [Cytophagales bacterium]